MTELYPRRVRENDPNSPNAASQAYSDRSPAKAARRDPVSPSARCW